MKALKVILSGGGTGGHIFPAIAIANEIKKLVPGADILFVGALGKMEMEKVPNAGYKIIGIPIAGIQRKFTLANLKLPFLIVRSMVQTRRIVRDFQPNVAIGTGGYASGPLLKAAGNRGIPTLLHESNSYAGITNKILSKRANRICVAYEGMEQFFPKEKIMLTGNPVRQDIAGIENKREEAFSFFQLNKHQKTILVIGGSLGAKGINEAIGAGLQQLADQNIQLLWQTGKPYFETARSQAAPFAEKNIKALDFITRMDLAYALADIVISRAGAGAISELCIVRKPSILVPLPTAAEDHQTKNAMALASRHAALLVKDSDARTNLLNTAIDLLADTTKQASLAENMGQMAFHDSANVIAREVLKLANYPIHA